MSKTETSGQRAEVEIFGKRYTLVSDESVAYAQEISLFVDRKMTEIAADRNLADTTKIAVMAAMEIADELMKVRAARKVDLVAAEQAGRRLGAIVGESGQ